MILRRFFIYCVLFTALVSCHSSSTKIPNDILSPEELLPIMVDVHVVEGVRHCAFNLNHFSSDSRSPFYCPPPAQANFMCMHVMHSTPSLVVRFGEKMNPKQVGFSCTPVCS